jgi:hypothetical protein
MVPRQSAEVVCFLFGRADGVFAKVAIGVVAAYQQTGVVAGYYQ